MMSPKVFLDMAKNLGGSKGNEIELPPPSGWFDRLINGVNRLGRPLLLVGVILFFIWGISDPVGFVTVMEAFGKTPEWITTAILLVISIFGTGRVIGDFKKRQTISMKKTETVEEVTMEEAPPTNRKFDNLEEDDDDDDIAELPGENSAIDQWKKDANTKAS